MKVSPLRGRRESRGGEEKRKKGEGNHDELYCESEEGLQAGS